VAYTAGAYSMAASVVQSTDSGGRSVLYFVDDEVNQVLRVHPSLPGPSSSTVLCGAQQLIAARATSPSPQPKPAAVSDDDSCESTSVFERVHAIGLDRFKAGALYVCDQALGLSHFDTATGTIILISPAVVHCIE
jgi:hypothetical protein